MSRDYHATEFIGRLAADPDTRYGETNGTARTRFRVLVNEEFKDRNEQTQKHVESSHSTAWPRRVAISSAAAGGYSSGAGTELAVTRGRAGRNGG